MGRSAFVLLFLAWRHSIGPVLTIDPWRAADCIQRESPDALQTVTDEWDYEILSERLHGEHGPVSCGRPRPSASHIG